MDAEGDKRMDEGRGTARIEGVGKEGGMIRN